MVVVFIAQSHIMSRGWAVWAEHENVQGETCLANYASAERSDDPINKAVTHLPPSSDMTVHAVVTWSVPGGAVLHHPGGVFPVPLDVVPGVEVLPPPHQVHAVPHGRHPAKGQASRRRLLYLLPLARGPREDVTWLPVTMY